MQRYLVLALIGVSLLSLALLSPSPNKAGQESLSREVEEIKNSQNPKKQAEILTELLKRVGPAQAQEELYRSGMPFTGQTHLLVHTVGQFVYENYGTKGLPECKDYFLSACYHGFILNTLADYGIEGMTEVMDGCKSAGPEVVPQCAHGAGHGFVAWHDYNLVKALEMCDELGEQLEKGSSTSPFPYFNCYDGVFMENFWGVHDGKPSDKRWVKAGDLNYPCNDLRIEEKYLRACWGNQATLAYQHYGGNLIKTALFCDAVKEEEYRDMCYNNLARQIHPLTEGEVRKVFSLCATATGEERQNECILTNMNAYWGVGDNELPFEICETSPMRLRNRCFSSLSGLVNFRYGTDQTKRGSYCGRIPSDIKPNLCQD